MSVATANGVASQWRNATKAEPCPVCNKPDWCSMTGPVDAPDAAYCHRIESDNPRKKGWIHQFRTNPGFTPPPASVPESRAAFATSAEAIAVCESIVGRPHDRKWTYRDAEDRPAMIVLRWDATDTSGKEIRPLTRGEGGWNIGAMKQPRPLYDLPALLTAAEVYVVEGEKCVDEAKSIGLPATTWAGGSGAVDQTNWTPLAGKRVTIWPDKDKPGNEAAISIAAKLAALQPPADVRIIDPPDSLPEKGDLCDWLSDHDAVEPDALRELIAKLPTRSREATAADNPYRRPVKLWTFAELRKEHPHLAEPIVEGLYRAGETVNIIAPPKYGKSWFMYYKALCIITGRPIFERFAVRRGRVLFVDNELHAATLANRIPAVAQAMGIEPKDYQDRFLFWTLRGDLRSLNELQADFEALEPGTVDVVILDAKYRFATEGQSENDNSAETLIYNRIDQYAAKTGAAFVLVHHASKGMQGGKAVTDVGAGAGAQSRAADCHIVLREHEEPGVVVLDAALRSFAPIEPLPLRWEFPLWRADESVDPAKLKGNQTKGEQRQSDRDRKGFDAILAALLDGPLTERAIRKAVGMGKERAERLLDMLESQGHIESQCVDVNGNEATEYRIPESQTQGGGL